MKRFLYRIRQFQRAHTENPSPADIGRAKAVLTPELFRLFTRMQPFEQAHALRVYDRLVKEGYSQPDLLAAALLHDVGKVRSPLKPGERAAAVLAKKLSPSISQIIGQGRPKGWNKGIVVAEKHAAWGAEMAAAAGATPLTTELIARHQDADLLDLKEDVQKYLAALQRVDRVS